MKMLFHGVFQMTPRDLLRRATYGESRDPNTGEISYMKRIGGALYPRFHVYIETLSDGFAVNIHLDQKQPSYGGGSAHNGEYDGDTVEREAERIRSAIEELRLA